MSPTNQLPTAREIRDLITEAQTLTLSLRQLLRDLPALNGTTRELALDRQQDLWTLMGQEPWRANELFRRAKGELGLSESTTRRYLAKGIEDGLVLRLDQGTIVQFILASSPQASVLLQAQGDDLAYWLLRAFYSEAPTSQPLDDVLAPALEYGAWTRPTLLAALDDLAARGLLTLADSQVEISGEGIKERARIA